jgi:Family of unknown function (DUF5677)
VADGAQGQRRPPAGRVLEAIAGLEQLVSVSLPIDLPPGATWWDARCATMISRMMDSVESIAVLITADRAVDAGALIRVLYEAVTKFCWIAVDPDARYARWQADAIAWDRKLVNDARAHGVELKMPVVDEDALGVPIVETPLVQLAKKVDEHWGGQLVGFEAAGHGLGGLVTFRELYVPLYRTLSEAVHSRPDSCGPTWRSGRTSGGWAKAPGTRACSSRSSCRCTPRRCWFATSGWGGPIRTRS